MKRSLCVLVVAVCIAGCDDNLCDGDQRYSHGLCYEIDAEVAVDSAFPHFGDPCTADPDCGAPATYCAKEPGAATGYCTRTGCLTDATICPAGWTCLDLGVFAPGLPAICKKP